MEMFGTYIFLWMKGVWKGVWRQLLTDGDPEYLLIVF